ncbi:MAG: hypothetical protein IJ184_03135 [Alphaproteobacteria bacterium]|nr:hypothetical protein [Alphaproteobacteria bacterium]
MTDLSAADVGALMMANGGRGGMTGAGAGALGGIGGFLGGILLGGILGGGNWFGNRGGFNNAIGYENLATSNEVQRGFDNQNSMANQREILAQIANGTAQGIATTNQSFQNMIGFIGDKYNEITRDIAAVQVSQANALANQNQCCCDTKLLLTEQNAGTNANIAQSRYDAAMNTAALQASIAAEGQKTRDLFTQDRLSQMQNRINQLELAQATSNIVRYPSGWTYNAGTSPFCNCGCNG